MANQKEEKSEEIPEGARKFGYLEKKMYDWVIDHTNQTELTKWDRRIGIMLWYSEKMAKRYIMLPPLMLLHLYLVDKMGFQSWVVFAFLVTWLFRD